MEEEIEKERGGEEEEEEQMNQPSFSVDCYRTATFHKPHAKAGEQKRTAVLKVKKDSI